MSMHIQTIRVVCLHTDEARRAENLAHWIDPHLRDLYDDPKEQDVARKLFNSVLHRELRYEEEKAIRLLKMLKDVYSCIARKREEMLELKQSAPAHAPDNQLILRPKEFIQMMIDNYAHQMDTVGEICEIFEKEVDPVNFEDTYV